MHCAARAGQLPCLALLLASCPGPDPPDQAGRTPLHWAAAAGRFGLEPVRLLISLGSNLTGAGAGLGALHWAVRARPRPCPTSLALLARQGGPAACQDRDPEGRTPAQVAQN